MLIVLIVNYIIRHAVAMKRHLKFFMIDNFYGSNKHPQAQRTEIFYEITDT